MQSDLEDKGWKVFLVPYEVSSRGQILKTTKSSIIYTLKQFKIKIKAEQLLFKQLSKIALLCTFSIFHAYQTKEWVSPPLLKPWTSLELACSWKWFTMQRLCLAYSSTFVLFIVTVSVKIKVFFSLVGFQLTFTFWGGNRAKSIQNSFSLVEHVIRARWLKHVMQKNKNWDMRFCFGLPRRSEKINKASWLLKFGLFLMNWYCGWFDVDVETESSG